jgi:integrase
VLSDIALKKLKPQAARYKIADRDGLYASVGSTGIITFRYDYRINGRRETLTIGKYGLSGISLALAREKLIDAKNAIAQGQSPAQLKKRQKRRTADSRKFEELAENWFSDAEMADSTRAMRRGTYNRDIYPQLKGRLLAEIKAEDLRALCDRVKARGAPATAVHVREVVKCVFDYANLKGHDVKNPADEVAPKSIATFKARDRALSPAEIRIMYKQMDYIAATPDHRLALRFILLTMVRKGELIKATWPEVDFEHAVWCIPKERMKARKPHNVYLSRQALDILIALKACAGGSPFILPARNNPDTHIALGSLNKTAQAIAARAQSEGLPLGDFTLHDLRRTGSTILNEAGFNGDWIEKALAHEYSHSSRSIYNKAQYAEQRRHMLQEWADMIDAWVAGKTRAPVLLPPGAQTKVMQASV